MKNALIIFAIVVPFLIINQLAFDGKSSVLSVVIFTIPFVGLNILLKKSHSEFLKNEVFKKVFITCLLTGVFYSIWMGTYQFFLMNYIDPEGAQEMLKEAEKSAKSLFPDRSDEAMQLNTQLYASPVYLIFSHLLLNFFFFSLIGLILGFQFKSKATQQ
jgi:hypothetical protein